MADVRFDWSINIGTVIAVGVFLVTLYRLHQTNTKNVKDAATGMARIETKLETLWQWWTTGRGIR